MPQLRNSELKFGWPAQLLHWVIAILIIGMICVGLYMVTLPNGLDKLKLYGLHKSTGAVVLIFVIFRLLWRQMNFQPHVPLENGRGIVYSSSTYKLMNFISHYWHMAIYVLILIMPLSGWMMSSAYGFPVSVYGWFTLPNLIGPNKANADLFKTIHDWTAYVLIFFIIGHIFAALFHHFIIKDITLKRMLPVLAIILFSFSAQAKDGVMQYDVNQKKSSIKFQATQNGAPAVGEFTGYKAQIAFGSGDLADSKVVVEINAGSVTSTYDELVSTLKGAEWLDVAKFPTAKFESTKFVHLAGDNYTADGNLTIRDKTVPVQIKFTLKTPDAKSAIVDGETTISRTAFGVGWADKSSVKDEVKVTVHVEATTK